MDTVWPCSTSRTASPDPTRPQPTTTTCTGSMQHGIASAGQLTGCGLPERREARCPVPEARGEAASRHGRASRRPSRRGGARGPGLSPGAPVAGPEALPSPTTSTCPRTLRYRLKNALLGPPIATERQSVGAARQAHRPGRAVVRRHLVLGLRHRADPAAAGQVHRRRRLRARRAGDHRRHRRPALRDGSRTSRW